ncbi:Mur ligase family protein, partial [Actinotignum timonense]
AAGGLTVATNRGGDNMSEGVLSALMEEPTADVAVLEVDEMHVRKVAAAVNPDVLVFLNLSRDQLDRVGEIATIERRLRA